MYSIAQNGLGTPATLAPILSWLTPKALNWWDQQKVKALVPEFPQVFEQAVTDWAKLKIGAKQNLFTRVQAEESLEWFRQLPRLWETIRPNFTDKTDFVSRVDSFVNQLKTDRLYETGSLGFVVSGTVVAGILIVGGVASALWAVGFIQEQGNISDMIDGVVSGSIPPDVLAKAVKEESNGGLFGGISDALQWLVIAGMAYFIVPKVFSR